MNYEEDSRAFQLLVEKFGSTYKATVYLMRKSRMLADKTDNLILHSEAITWALRGEKPGVLKDLDHLPKRVDYKNLYIDEILSYVDDKDVCQSVRDSFYYSRKAKNLVYIYDKVLEPTRQARVRILVRLIWYELYPHYIDRRSESNGERNK